MQTFRWAWERRTHLGHSRNPVRPMTRRTFRMARQSTWGGFPDHLNIVCTRRKALFGKPRKGRTACYWGPLVRRTSAPFAIDLSCIREGSFFIGVTRDTLSTRAETATRILFRLTCFYYFKTFRQSYIRIAWALLDFRKSFFTKNRECLSCYVNKYTIRFR